MKNPRRKKPRANRRTRAERRRHPSPGPGLDECAASSSAEVSPLSEGGSLAPSDVGEGVYLRFGYSPEGGVSRDWLELTFARWLLR